MFVTQGGIGFDGSENHVFDYVREKNHHIAFLLFSL